MELVAAGFQDLSKSVISNMLMSKEDYLNFAWVGFFTNPGIVCN